MLFLVLLVLLVVLVLMDRKLRAMRIAAARQEMENRRALGYVIVGYSEWTGKPYWLKNVKGAK